MLNIDNDPKFLSRVSKIKNKDQKERVKKQIRKITKNPEIGKPMQYARKGTREVYVTPYRLSYEYIKEKNSLVFLDLYHKDKQ